MHLYDSRVGEFIPRASSGQIADALSRNFLTKLDRHATESEIRSWRNSLGAFADAVDGVGMEDSWIVLEYQLPLSSSRVDCMLLGSDAGRRRNAVLVELKQWDGCETHYVPDVVSLGGEQKLHPSAQARAYRRYLREAHSAFAGGKVDLHSCAYLHNVRSERGSNFFADGYRPLLAESPAFSAATTEDLARFVGERTGMGADVDLVESVLQGQYQPSKTLLSNVAASIAGHEPWKLLDAQLVVYNQILKDIEVARQHNRRRVIIVTGGPGTGKSVIAVQVVGEAAQRGYSVAHATGSKAFTTNLRGVVGDEADAVFRYTHNFRDAAPVSVDLAVVDEAHRLRLKTQFGPSIYSRRPQAEEIIDASRVAVFLLDQAQSVRLNEVGSAWGIADYARSKGIPVVTHDLDVQFRCAGSESYVKWVEHALGLREEQSTAWRANGEYDVRIFDTPGALEAAIREKAAAGRTARLVAGFCWEWSEPLENGGLVRDVKIGGWSMPWNRKPPEMCKRKGSMPPPAQHPYTIWATQGRGVEEIGCIYSAQGFEFDYVGVIWGRDLRWDERRRRWLPELGANSDTSFKRGLTKDPELAVRQLAHVYRVLATRGMKGAYFYFQDAETRRHVESLLKG